MIRTKFIQQLAEELPPIIVRSHVSKLTGGLVAPKTLANADSTGNGPTEREIVANKVVYSRQSFIDWLTERFPEQSRYLKRGIKCHN